MKVLIVGASDTLGTYLPDRSQGTFPILTRELPVAFKEPVEVGHMRFYSHFKNAPQHAYANVRDRAPDICIIAAHSMAFTTPTVGARLVHMFGWKTGRWLERRIWDFDRLARKRAVARWIHRPAKGLAHRTVGTAVHASVDATIRDYAETLALLTRIEDMQILLLGTFQPRRDGDVAPHAQLNAGLARAAALRRVRWIDRQEIVAGLGADAFQSNGLYSTPALHRAVADAVITALTAD